MKWGIDMEKEKKSKSPKNILKVLLILLLLLILLWVIYEVSIYSDGKLDNSNPMSREEVIKLLEKGKTYSNYYYCSENIGLFNDKNKNEYYIKDKIVASYFNSRITNWTDYNTGDVISLFGENKAMLSSNVNVEQINIPNQYGFDYSLIADREHYNFDYKYLGQKEKYGKTLIMVSVWDEEEKGQPVKFSIDKQTGLIFERIDYMKLGFLTIKLTCNRNVKLDIVTDEDVAKPDLTKYEILGTNLTNYNHI